MRLRLPTSAGLAGSASEIVFLGFAAGLLSLGTTATSVYSPALSSISWVVPAEYRECLSLAAVADDLLELHREIAKRAGDAVFFISMLSGLAAVDLIENQAAVRARLSALTAAYAGEVNPGRDPRTHDFGVSLLESRGGLVSLCFVMHFCRICRCSCAFSGREDGNCEAGRDQGQTKTATRENDAGRGQLERKTPQIRPIEKLGCSEAASDPRSSDAIAPGIFSAYSLTPRLQCGGPLALRSRRSFSRTRRSRSARARCPSITASCCSRPSSRSTEARAFLVSASRPASRA